MSDDSDYEPLQRRKRKIRYIHDSSSSDSSIEIRKRNRASQKNYISDSDSDTDSSLVCARRGRRVGRVSSDSSNANAAPSSSEQSDGGFEGSSSEWESDYSSKDPINKPGTAKDGTASDSSDDQAEKCPICLLTFKNQEVGVPESCDHTFCADCIQEWSKNMNTCPVDRLPFNLILIRESLNGRFLREIQVQLQEQQNELVIFEDPTYCEICGSCENEDRMLLCDGCDLGFHLECLVPPLGEVPAGAWFCNYCRPLDVDMDVYEVEVHRFSDGEEEAMGWAEGRRHGTTSPRLVPRTPRTERLRQRITEQRNLANESTQHNPASASSGVEDLSQPGPSTSSSTPPPRRLQTKKKKQKRRKRKLKPRYRLVYRVDEVTGETIAVKKLIKRRRRKKAKKKKGRHARLVEPRATSVKKRLAKQLGICKPRNVVQHTPDVKISDGGNNIGNQRFQAGIPTLHLFGQHDELDYFSNSDTEYGDSSVLVRRRPTRSDAAVLQRRARQKSVPLPSTAIATQSDLLSSILESQARLHSKSATLTLNGDGTVKVDDFTQNNRVNVNNNVINGKKTPMYPGNGTNNTNSNAHSYNNGRNGHDSDYGNYNYAPTSTVRAYGVAGSSSGGDDNEGPRDYSQAGLYRMYDQEEKEKKEKDEQKPCTSASDTPGSSDSSKSDSDLDIYSDIEDVSTSKIEETDTKNDFPTGGQSQNTGKNAGSSHRCKENNPSLSNSDEEDNSDAELVIDTENADQSEKQDDDTENAKDETVSSTVDSEYISPVQRVSAAHSTSEIQSGPVQSTSQTGFDVMEVEDDGENEEEDDYQDGCPNFSIYSTESMNFAKTSELELLSADNRVGCSSEVTSGVQETSGTSEPLKKSYQSLYSDSEDENIKIDLPKTFGIGDIRNMTEDISEEERSYTPCLDERVVAHSDGIEGLDTEMISDEDRDDFDEAHEMKTISDGEALEINAKESELDFTKPEDYEEGEIVDKSKSVRVDVEEEKVVEEKKEAEVEAKKKKENTESSSKIVEKKHESPVKNKETFKKLSKSNRDRNYRDKDRDRSKSKERKGKENRKDKKKEKRKEIERYDVRSIIADKPRRLKDKFGRDMKRSASRSSRSLTPPRRSPPRVRERSVSKDKTKKREARSRSKSPEQSTSRTHRKKRRRSDSNEGRKRRKRSRSRSRRKGRSPSRHRSTSVKRRREWSEQRREREWETTDRSQSTEVVRRASPSWTPPRVVDKPMNPHNLTVILTNDVKRKEKKKKGERRKEAGEKRSKRRRNDRTPPPSKEVFASGDNILVSVSFNKDTESRDVTTTTTRRKREVVKEKKQKKEKKKVKKKPQVDLSGVKPVAIIDLDRSPFKVLTPSPKNVIVLSDSDNAESNDLIGLQKAICDSSQQVVSPKHGANYSTGPKTPPEPQVKFSLTAKPPQMRPISNPLHDPEDVEPDIDVQEELEQRLNEVAHKGPNTPPDPPNSPPSSPDVYDPFDPTKSRSPTPEAMQTAAQSSSPSRGDSRDESALERSCESAVKSPVAKTPDVVKSHTPPLLDTQPDSQSSVVVVECPVEQSSSPPERNIGVVINQVVQQQSSIFPSVASKPVAPTVPYSSSSQSLITSTPIAANLTVPRINILNSTILTPPPHVVASLPQRIILPTVTKTSPVKTSQMKSPIKSTPIKPMPSKNVLGKSKSGRKSSSRNQNGSDEVVNLDFDSPYSPGSSDYEDLFEPPPETGVKSTSSVAKALSAKVKPPPKVQNAFDALFGAGGSPGFKSNKTKADKNKPAKRSAFSPAKGTKLVGVKLDEDNLRILDELPNSAVEMQVKDKFLKKLNRQERVVEEVKLVLKPHYNKKRINKEEYKDILRRAVPKICHNRSGEINPHKIKNLIEAYVKKIRHSKKVTSSSSVNSQKI